MSQSSLPPEIRELPIAERIELATQIWDSVAEDDQHFELTDSQKAELDRRLAHHKESPDRGRTWEEVKIRLLGN